MLMDLSDMHRTERGNMIRALYRTQAGHTRTDLGLEAFATALGDDSGLLWVDPAEESPER